MMFVKKKNVRTRSCCRHAMQHAALSNLFLIYFVINYWNYVFRAEGMGKYLIYS